MFSTPMVNDGLTTRRLQPGDIMNLFDPIPPAADTTNTTFSYSVANILNNPSYVRNPAGVSTDTFPDASALVTALTSILGVSFVPAGLSFRFRVINLSANLLTGAVTANTGATMTRGNVPASTTKDFQFNITNGSPAVTVPNVTSANASAVLSGFTSAQLRQLSVGMVVQNAVVGCQGFTIIGVNLTAGTVTLSSTATGAGPSTFTFYPTYTVTGLGA
jgi:hypothetical protein